MLRSLIKKLLFPASLALLVAATVYSMAPWERKLLSGGVLDGVDLSTIANVSFVKPKGTVSPVGNVVVIEKVFIEFTTPADNILINAEELSETPIIFVSSIGPLPAGVQISGNKIYTPQGGFTPFGVVAAYMDPNNVFTQYSSELTVEPSNSCSSLQTSLFRAYGGSVDFFDPADLPVPAQTENPFDFEDDIDTVTFSYVHPEAMPLLNPTPFGAATFDISIAMVEGLAERAKIVSSNGDGTYQIQVRDEGLDTVETASNFAYVFNDLLGLDSPFIASTGPASQVHLTAKELGPHANEYYCTQNGAPILLTGHCMVGGATGSIDVLTTPLTLDSIIHQGDTNMVYVGNGHGIAEWTSSNPSVLEVSSLKEASEKEAGPPAFVSELLAELPTLSTGAGSYELSNCQETIDEDTEEVTERTCDVNISVPISYDITGNNYTVVVPVGDEVVEVDVSGNTLLGTIEGTGTWIDDIGLSMQVTGTVQGAVSGVAGGEAAGTVNGFIQANANSNINIESTDLLNVTILKNAVINSFEPSDVIEGFLTAVPNTFVSNVSLIDGGGVTHLALLNAKKGGKSILSVTDEFGCLAAMEVTVANQIVALQMVGKEEGDTLEVGETVQVRAFVGYDGEEVEEENQITSDAGIEWFSSNPNVATIDPTGLVTVLAPGKTNITAKYDTEIAEVGVIESDPLLVNVAKIKGLTISLDEATQAKLPGDVIDQAHETVSLILHSPDAVGHSLTIEGVKVDIAYPNPIGTYNSKLERIAAIAGQLAEDLEAIENSLTDPVLKITPSLQYPGVITLEPLNQDSNTDGDNTQDLNENGRVDASSNAFVEDLTVLPLFSSIVPLPASESYGVMVVAEYDNGATARLLPTEVQWVNAPANSLQQASLDAGILKFDQVSGLSTVEARLTNADNSMVKSNALKVEVSSGPVVEFLKRIGNGPILKGASLLLQAKITDVNTVADVQDIMVHLVKSNQSSYQNILSDPDAVWFAAMPYVDQVTVVDQGDAQPQEAPADPENPEAEAPAPQPAPEPALPYRIYNIPVDMPIDGTLFDGLYRLVFSITDKNNHTAHAVYSITLGQVASGDVNQDGAFNMIDVIIAFQIAAGMIANPTPEQIAAADANGSGSVTMIDVILLYQTLVG